MTADDFALWLALAVIAVGAVAIAWNLNALIAAAREWWRKQ